MSSTPMITLGSEIYVWPRSSQKTSQICFICSSTGLSVYVTEFILGAQCGFTIGIQMVDVMSCEAFTWRSSHNRWYCHALGVFLHSTPIPRLAIYCIILIDSRTDVPELCAKKAIT
ncbi:hypothetical protein EDB19DRAFT_1834916 [Suillus lakei]|nr:hypothetical protein EDB19DRAFT_1834916 [Suillus lakei]